MSKPIRAEQPQKRKSLGAQLGRSETVTVRLDPRLRYLADIASRRQRRTLSSFIEWAIEESLSRVFLSESPDETSVADEAKFLWDVDEPDRFVKLAIRHPGLLTHDQQILWKLIRENGAVWKGVYTGPNKEWVWSLNSASVDYEELRKAWPTFVMVAAGDKPATELPTWEPIGKIRDVPF